MPINNNEEFKQDFDRKISTKKLFTEEDKLNIIYKARNLDNKKQKYNLKHILYFTIAAAIFFLLIIPSKFMDNGSLNNIDNNGMDTHSKNDDFDYEALLDIEFPTEKEEFIKILGDNYMPVKQSNDSLDDMESLRWDYPVITEYDYEEEYDFLDTNGIKEGKINAQVIASFNNDELISFSMLFKDENGKIFIYQKNKENVNKIPLN